MNKEPLFSASQLEFVKEQYKMLLTFALAIEDRILTVFTGTVTITVTLLIAICGYLFRQDHRSMGVGEAYIALIPMLVIAPSLLLISDLRKDMARIAGYLLVFVEERELGPSWGINLLAFRNSPSSDSLDTVPLTYLALTVACCSAFLFSLSSEGGSLYKHTPVLFATAAILIPLNRRWRDAIAYFPESAIIWRSVRDAVDTN